jgi:prepilin-type N-terminal cleavage/methylation domain-containing protein
MKKRSYNRRKAFTMLELVFVIVVLGILAKFGVDLFKQIYENYTRTTIAASLMSKTEVAVLQIANRLSYRIKDSVIASTGSTGDFRPLISANAGDNVFEWIGIDNDGWDSGSWSGIIDLNSTNTDYTHLASPGTSALPDNGALLFNGSKVDVNNSFGWHNHSASDLYIYDTPATALGGVIPFTGNPFSAGDDIYEYYQVAGSAYALELINNTLYLHQGYYPWNNGTFTGTGDIVADHVKTFTLQKTGDIIKIELCLHENDFMDEGEYSICKTKIVF